MTGRNPPQPPFPYCGIVTGFSAPYGRRTTAPSPLVPGFMDVAIGGHPYRAETSFEPFRRDAYRSDTVPMVAGKSDLTNIPGQASINTQGLWRREMEDWCFGAGQLYLDRRASLANRFRSSQGVYVGTQWYASLLNDTTCVLAGSLTQVLVAGSYCYVIDGSSVQVSSDLSTWTTVGGLAGTPTMLATDGAHLYVAAGTTIYISDVGDSSVTAWITEFPANLDHLWYAGSYFFAAAGAQLFWIDQATGSSPAWDTAIYDETDLLMTHNAESWTWTAAAAGNSWVYLGGSTSTAGSNYGCIYKTQLNSEATAMIAPIVAATMPGGELVTALYAVANYIMLGTTLGCRFCETLGINDPGGNAGDLKIGPIIPDPLPPQIVGVTEPVQCFTGQGRFVWFGFSDYSDVLTGLGRLDLSNFIDHQAPAWVSDLMVSGQGLVISMDWWGSREVPAVVGCNIGAPIFVVSGQGLYTTAKTFVPQGTIDLPTITYGLPDNKVALKLGFDGHGTGPVSASVSVDDGLTTYTTPSVALANELTELQLPRLVGECFDVQVQINAGADNTESSFLRRLMMKALPAIVAPTQHRVIIECFEYVEGRSGQLMYVDPYVEFAYLDGLRQRQEVVLYQEGSQLVIPIVIKSISRLIYNERSAPEGGFNQRFEIVLQTIDD